MLITHPDYWQTPQPMFEQVQFVPYQKCPICDGSGKIEEFDGLHPPRDITCPTCQGVRIIPMHCVKMEPLITVTAPSERIRIAHTNEMCSNCHKVTGHDRYAEQINNQYTEYTVCEECKHNSNYIMGTQVKKTL